jgi:hypothetical protein
MINPLLLTALDVAVQINSVSSFMIVVKKT